MDFYKVPIGFGLALSANTAAMNRYAHLSESQKQDILNRAHSVRSEQEMYLLVASLANFLPLSKERWRVWSSDDNFSRYWNTIVAHADNPDLSALVFA